MSTSKPQQRAKNLWKATAEALLSSDEVDVIYDRLGGLSVALDPDPLAYGPARMQEKIAICRKYLSETELIFLDVSHRLHKLKRELRAKESALDLSTKYLYVEDPEVRAGRNIADRDAFAAMKLKDEWMDVHGCTQRVLDMGAVLTVIKAKRSDLKDTQNRLRDQVRLCSQELALGGIWGAKRKGAPELEPGQGRASRSDVDSVTDFIAEMGGLGEVNLVTLEDEEVEEPPKEKPLVEFVRPNQVDLALLGATAIEGAMPETISGIVSDTVLPKSSGKTASDVLPSNGTATVEIDRILTRVQIPTTKMTSKKGNAFGETDIDALLAVFE